MKLLIIIFNKLGNQVVEDIKRAYDELIRRISVAIGERSAIVYKKIE